MSENDPHGALACYNDPDDISMESLASALKETTGTYAPEKLFACLMLADANIARAASGKPLPAFEVEISLADEDERKAELWVELVGVALKTSLRGSSLARLQRGLALVPATRGSQ
jgi:hypothetical protein